MNPDIDAGKTLAIPALRIGIIYPLPSAEDGYPYMAARLKPAVDVLIAHTDAIDLHTVGDCRRTGDWDHLSPGVEELRKHNVAICMWACTSGSFVYGLAGARAQAQNIANQLVA